MKKLKVSLLALCALAGGALVASAASGDKGFTYNLNVGFTNPVNIVDIFGVPSVKTNFSLSAGSDGVTMTDGSGKIDGVWDMYITNLAAAAPLVDGDYVVDISGSVTTVTKSGNPNPVPVVNVTMKGNGRSHDDAETTNGPASFSLTFSTKSGAGLATNTSSVGPFTTNVTVVDGNNNVIRIDSYNPTTNTTVSSGPLVLPFLTFTVHTHDTNGLPNITNRIIEVSSGQATNNTVAAPAVNFKFWFGTGTLVSNVYFIFGTNLFQITKLGEIVSYSIINGTTNGSTTATPIYGIAIGDVPSFINAFNQANNSAAGSNPISLVSGVVTNTGTTAGGTVTSTTTVSGIPGPYSDSWLEVSGLVNGSVKQGKKSVSVKNATGLYTTPHEVFTAFTVTNLTTNTSATATATADANGVITNVTIVDGGSGYVGAPTVTVTTPGNGSNATFTASVGGGAVTNIAIANAGTNYASGVALALTISEVTGSGSQYVQEQTVSGGGLALDLFDNFRAKLVQFNKSIWSSSDDPYAGFKGSGSITTPKGKPSTYTLNQKGVSRAKGSSLTFKGNTDSNSVVSLTAQTNVVAITNLASLAKWSHSFTNITGISQQMSFSETVTNIGIDLGAGTTNVVVSHNTWGVGNPPLTAAGLAIPGLGKTNIDTLGIRTVTATGKLKGQALPKTGVSGVNP